MEINNNNNNSNKKVRSPGNEQETPSKHPCDPREEATAPNHKEPFEQRAAQRPSANPGPTEAQTRHEAAAKKAQEELAALARQQDQAKAKKLQLRPTQLTQGP